jgi:hypothetical protein
MVPMPIQLILPPIYLPAKPTVQGKTHDSHRLVLALSLSSGAALACDGASSARSPSVT